MRLSRHFGLNSVNPASYGGWPGNLIACCADATDLAALFARAGFDSQAIFDQDATLARMRDELAAAACACTAGDWFVLTYSGHGSQRDSSYSLSVQVESLCLYDHLLEDYWLRSYLSRFVAGVNVMIILDSCFSGGMDKSGRRIRVAPLYVTRGRALPSAAPRAFLPANIALLTACDSDETAEDGEDNGAYTETLLATMTGGAQTWSAWHAATASRMSRTHPRQHPQLLTISGTPQLTTPVFA
jgi:hypothetical protein